MEKAVKNRPMAIGGTGAKVSRAVKTVVLFALLLVYLAPFILIIINSLKTTRGILKYTLDLVDPLGVTFDNFVRAFEKMHFLRAFGNSLFVTGVSVALIVLISIGVITDVIGTAVTSADEQPFIAMASNRIRGAKQALQLIRKAERVSSLLNDVVGDIVGVVRGSAG